MELTGLMLTGLKQQQDVRSPTLTLQKNEQKSEDATVGKIVESWEKSQQRPKVTSGPLKSSEGPLTGLRPHISPRCISVHLKLVHLLAGGGFNNITISVGGGSGLAAALG